MAGISVVLVSARQVKQLKGRKTDVADSVWLARVCQFGLASPSHVPPKAFRETRALTRYRCALVGQRSRVRNRVQKVLDNGQVGAVLNAPPFRLRVHAVAHERQDMLEDDYCLPERRRHAHNLAARLRERPIHRSARNARHQRRFAVAPGDRQCRAAHPGPNGPDREPPLPG